MNKQTLAAPLLMTAAFASLVAASLSCEKTQTGKNGANPPTTANPTSSTNIQVIGGTNWATPGPSLQTNMPPGENPTGGNSSTTNTGELASITNLNSTATSNLPATPEPAPTSAASSTTQTQVVEMPSTAPQPPEKFYGDNDSVTNHLQRLLDNPDYFFRVRAGYEHTYHGDNNDTWYAGLKFYAYPDDLRVRLGKNAWLVPDADVEFSHQTLAKPDISHRSSGSDQGLNLRSSFTWPWFNWATRTPDRGDFYCPYARPLNFSLGPTANVGFDYLFDDNDSRYAGYFGARLTINRMAFVEYTVGRTEGLFGTRQQILTEIPLYVTRDQLVHYTFRGEWNHGVSSVPDVLQAGIFIEMPLDIMAHPQEWGDLIPFLQ